MLESLNMISTASLYSFEDAPRDRAEQIAEDIDRHNRLKNPLLVQPIENGYLLLDDASLMTAFSILNLRHVPAQIADLKTLSVRPWQRVIEGWHHHDLVDFALTFPRQVRLIKNPADCLVSFEAEVKFVEGDSYRICFSSDTCLNRADLGIKLAASVARKGRSFKSKLNHRAGDPFDAFPDASAILFPPVFTLDELGLIASRGMRLPHGYIRVDQPGRVLGIDFALSVLQADDPLEEKQQFLREMIRMRMFSDRTAYYDGAVFMFNG